MTSAGEYLRGAERLRRIADFMEAAGDARGAASAREFANAHTGWAHDALAVFSKRRQQAEARQRLAEFGRQRRRDQAVLDARQRLGKR